MANQRIYRKITKIEMASDNEVFDVTIEALHKDFLGDLKKHYGGDYRAACADFDIALTKKDCMEISSYAKVEGCGKYSGGMLWQLPVKVRAKISKMLPGEVISV